MKNIVYSLGCLVLLSCLDAEKKEFPTPEIVIVDNDSLSNAITDTALQTSKRDSIVAFAEKYLGTKYCYAGNTPETGFDCSGYVNYVFNHFGIDLPRSSSQFKDLGTPLKPEAFKKGDVLVFYGYQDSTSIGHLGIVYEVKGMESKFIHASSGSEYAVMISDLSSDMYTKRFYKCINVVSLDK